MLYNVTSGRVGHFEVSWLERILVKIFLIYEADHSHGIDHYFSHRLYVHLFILRLQNQVKIPAGMWAGRVDH